MRRTCDEGATLGDAGKAAGGLAQESLAVGAGNDGVGVAKHGGDGCARLALHVHEGVGRLHHRLCLCFLFYTSPSGFNRSVFPGSTIKYELLLVHPTCPVLEK